MAPRIDAPSRREQILREAARLFAERGFHGVGVDEIGAAVGISGPGLYRHFAGKDAMLAELLVGISGRLLTGGRRRAAAADEGADPLEVLDALVLGHIDFALDDRSLIVLHDRELDRLRDSDRKLVRQLQRQYVELWVDVVRRAYPALTESEARASVHAQPQPGVAAHRDAAESGLINVQRIQQRQHVLAQVVHAIGAWGDRAAAMAARVVADQAVTGGQRGHLRIPHLQCGAQ